MRKNIKHVIQLLGETAYLAERVPLEVTKDFHYNIMLGVEKGERSWGKSTLHVQTALLISHSDKSEKGTRGTSAVSSGKGY